MPVLCVWHLYMVAKAETSIESHDNAYLDGRASSEGLVRFYDILPEPRPDVALILTRQIYLNPYDLGYKRNLELFFNLGPSAYPAATLLFPLLVPPASNGWSYPRRSLPGPAETDVHQLHEPELAAGHVGNRAELGEVRGKYVMGDEGLTDDEEGGGGWMG